MVEVRIGDDWVNMLEPGYYARGRAKTVRRPPAPGVRPVPAPDGRRQPDRLHRPGLPGGAGRAQGDPHAGDRRVHRRQGSQESAGQVSRASFRKASGTGSRWRRCSSASRGSSCSTSRPAPWTRSPSGTWPTRSLRRGGDRRDVRHRVARHGVRGKWSATGWLHERREDTGDGHARSGPPAIKGS